VGATKMETPSKIALFRQHRSLNETALAVERCTRRCRRTQYFGRAEIEPII
jgi:hypothetical protein